MPGGDGIDSIAELGRRTNAIVVSMYASDEQKGRAVKAGAKGFFSKGVPLMMLAAAIRAVADGQDLIVLDDTARDELLEHYGEARLDPGAASLTPPTNSLNGSTSRRRRSRTISPPSSRSWP
jgi:DNA-binding NarL/FixJ family response regulator